MCANVMKMYTDRVLSCLPLKDVVCVLDQGQSGLQRQVHAQGGRYNPKVKTFFWQGAQNATTAISESIRAVRTFLFVGARNVTLTAQVNQSVNRSILFLCPLRYGRASGKRLGG